MKRIIMMIPVVLIMLPGSFSQRIPEGYILQYSQDFSKTAAIKDFRFNRVPEWSVKAVKGNGTLCFTSMQDTVTGHLIPVMAGFIDNRLFGDFILELSVMLKKDTSGGTFRILFGIRDSLRYYCVNVTPAAADSACNLYVVDNAPPVKVQPEATEKISAEADKWHKVRVERNIVNKSVRVFIDDLNEPCLEIKDRTYIMGYIGFGSDGGSGRIDDIKIWSQTVIPQPADFFKQWE